MILILRNNAMTEIPEIMIKEDMKIGEFLVENGCITPEALDEVLAIQKDNPNRLIGEILVTIGAMSKEEVIMAVEMFLIMTNSSVQHTHEWLDQDEIDLLMNKLNSKQS